MNLVFLGASRFGLRCLETCIKIPEVRIVGIVTAPEIFGISYRPSGVINVLHADMTSFARQWNLPVAILQRSMNEDRLIKKVAAWKPDAFMVAGWYHMIPKCWRAMAPAYGLHASLLPAYSGGAPLVWAMINGEEKTGITLFQMDGGVDSGPIAGQKEELILPTDTIATLYARIEERGLELLRELLPRIAEGTIELRPQDESKRRVFAQRSPEDGLVDWKKEAEYIERFIRSQTKPYPGAFTTLEGKLLHIWNAEPVSLANDNLETGKVYRTQNGSYLAACGAGAISIGWVTYEQKTYSKSQLSELFAQGGQRLGE